MRRYLSGVALLLLSGYATVTQLEIRNTEYHYLGNTEIQCHVPWSSLTNNPRVAKRINDHIFVDFVNQLPGNTSQAIVNQFARSATDPTANLDYMVKYCDIKILTFNMFIEGCRACCEPYNVPISFDLASDAAIILNDLFSRTTIIELSILTRKNIRGQINTFVTAHNSQTLEQMKKERGEDFNHAEFCVSYATYTDGLYYIDKFSPQKDHLTFLDGRCSNHVNRALDELGDFITKIPTTELQNQLVPYGQYLTIAKSTIPVSSAPGIDGKAIYGTLGRSMRVMLRVDYKYGDFFGGIYFYQKFGASIELVGRCGTVDNQHYELKISAAERTQEEITLELKDGIYQGIQESNGKTLPVRFEQYRYIARRRRIHLIRPTTRRSFNYRQYTFTLSKPCSRR